VAISLFFQKPSIFGAMWRPVRPFSRVLAAFRASFRVKLMSLVVVKVLPEMRRRQRRQPDVGTPTTHTEMCT
jgi:hypothetical protein